MRYLPLEEALSLELKSYPQLVTPKKCLVANTEIVACGGGGRGVATPAVISG